MTGLEPGPILDDAPEPIAPVRPTLEPGVVEGAERAAPERSSVAPPPETGAAIDLALAASAGGGRHLPVIVGAVVLLVAIIAYDVAVTVSDAFARHWSIGVLLAAIAGGVALTATVWVIREISGLSRLKQVEAMRLDLLTCLEIGEPAAFRLKVERSVSGIADGEALRTFREAAAAERDCSRIAFFAERAVLKAADARAAACVAKASRDVGLGSGFAPTPFISAVVVILRCITMVRAVASAYGHRPGIAGTWLLARQILTGAAMAASLDALSEGVAEIAGEVVEEIELPIVGKMAGKVVGKIAGKTGEGVVAARRTARIGIAAMELCRPLPFPPTAPCPGPSRILKAAFSG